MDDPVDTSMLRVKLKYSKTDQYGRGVEVFVGRTGCTLCPVAGTLAYMAVRGTQAGSFFRFRDGTPLTKPKFTQRVREALCRAGLPYEHFAGHSFRIGAATTAAKTGMEDSRIQALGIWNSTAFQTYIRTPRETLAETSSRLAHS